VTPFVKVEVLFLRNDVLIVMISSLVFQIRKYSVNTLIQVLLLHRIRTSNKVMKLETRGVTLLITFSNAMISFFSHIAS